MLYLKALVEGLDDIPAANAEIRADIHQQAQKLGWPAMHGLLAQIDPATAARLAPGDSQRIGRALEVWTATGQTLSSFHQSAKTPTPDWRIPIISLEPNDRTWLHQRISQRFDHMMANGFMDEVQQLRARGDLNPDLPAMRCVGYRQAWEGLDANWSQAEIRERGIFATRQLAKRQITWLRSMPHRVVVAAEESQASARVIDLTLPMCP
jgi:tRNA dimethylallyltransferase